MASSFGRVERRISNIMYVCQVKSTSLMGFFILGFCKESNGFPKNEGGQALLCP
jgi:hypothetical protein